MAAFLCCSPMGRTALEQLSHLCAPAVQGERCWVHSGSSAESLKGLYTHCLSLPCGFARLLSVFLESWQIANESFSVLQELIPCVCAAVQLLLYIPQHCFPLHHPLPNARLHFLGLVSACRFYMFAVLSQPCCYAVLTVGHQPRPSHGPTNIPRISFCLFLCLWNHGIIVSKARLKSRETTSVTLSLSSGAVSPLQKVAGLVRQNKLVSPTRLALTVPKKDLHFPLGGSLPLNTVSIPALILWWELHPSD